MCKIAKFNAEDSKRQGDDEAVQSLPAYLHLNSLAVEWVVAVNIHNWSRYVAVISHDIRVYCGRFVGPSRAVHYMDGPPTKNIKEKNFNRSAPG